MGEILALALLLSRFYFPVPVCGMKSNFHTHVSVTGRVALIKREADGDTHMRLVANGCFITAECIPELPCSVKPHVGDSVTVQGISRFDGEHKWYEVHPVEHIKQNP